MTDFLLLEQIHKLISDLKKPRLMFRKGICAKGYFKPYLPLSEYTDAELFGEELREFPVTVRFSSMLGDAGTADTRRNLRGMSVRFYDTSGASQSRSKIYDMICSNFPAFFIHDLKQFPQLHCAMTVQESFDRIDPERFWEFVTEHREALLCTLYLYSGMGLGGSYLNQIWHEVNPCIWTKNGAETAIVRCQWHPLTHQEKPISKEYAEFLYGFDPHRAGKELQRSIMEGHFPAFELSVQMMEPDQFHGNPDCRRRTVPWNETEYPSMAVGMMKLVELEDETEWDSEKAATPGNTMEGISLYCDEFAGMMDYLHRRSAAERGK